MSAKKHYRKIFWCAIDAFLSSHYSTRVFPTGPVTHSFTFWNVEDSDTPRFWLHRNLITWEHAWWWGLCFAQHLYASLFVNHRAVETWRRDFFFFLEIGAEINSISNNCENILSLNEKSIVWLYRNIFIEVCVI